MMVVETDVEQLGQKINKALAQAIHHSKILQLLSVLLIISNLYLL
jgi:hypothetical protein